MTLPDQEQPTHEYQKRALERNRAAYEAMRESLERDHMDEWVVIREEELAGTYGSEDQAIDYAVRCFGWGPYYIRQIGAPIKTYFAPTAITLGPLNADR